MNSILKGRKPAYGRIVSAVLTAVILFGIVPKAIRLKKIYDGEIIANIPDSEKYPVMGVDVSRYQGNIDWPVIAGQNVRFAFIKATEGSSHQDPCFLRNWKEVGETDIFAGAYHFFSFESSGETQAQNFISTVGDLCSSNLPPVVDLEFYGGYSDNPLSRRETQQILNDLLGTLEEYYHVKPIIYTTTRAYYHYILGGGYGDYPLWFRNTYQEPLVRWSFWQYSDEGLLAGYDGRQADSTEIYIDLNVYHSSYEDFLEEFSLSESTRETLVNYEKEEKENKT